jgi:hypothetical protein
MHSPRRVKQFAVALSHNGQRSREAMMLLRCDPPIESSPDASGTLHSDMAVRRRRELG